MYTFFQKKKKKTSVVEDVPPVQIGAPRDIEVQHQLRSHRSRRCTQTVHCNTAYRCWPYFITIRIFLNFMVLFIMRHLFFDFFRDFFFLTTMFVVGSILKFFDGVLLFNFLHISWCKIFFMLPFFWTFGSADHISCDRASYVTAPYKKYVVLFDGLSYPSSPWRSPSTSDVILLQPSI